jgi:hypothetical protein
MALSTIDTSSISGLGYGFKNRLINGSMTIDQRNSGASITFNDNVYPVDRFRSNVSQSSKMTAQQNAGSVTPPAGFTNYLGLTSSSAYSVLSTDYFNLCQFIEGYNFADMAWGTASAQPVTLSFWVRSSLTGTFGGSVSNSATNRCYVFSYTINSANTWEYKTVTIAGDTTGTWLTTNNQGLLLFFGLGCGTSVSGSAGSWGSTFYRSVTGAQSVVGTNAATFYITGVQLEKGTVATSFDYRPYGTELQLCQRYYWRLTSPDGSTRFGQGLIISSTQGRAIMNFPVPMRAPPTSVEQSGTATDYRVISGSATSTNLSSVLTFDTSNIYLATVTPTVASGLTSGNYFQLAANNTNAYVGFPAEL